MSIFSKIGNLFRKLFDAIRKIIAYILIVVAVILIIWAAVFSGGAALIVFGFAISQSMAFVIGALALVGAFLVDAETAGQVIGKIGDAIGNTLSSVTNAVAKAATSVAGGFFKTLLSSPIGVVAVGGLVLWGFSVLTDNDDNAVTVDSKDPNKGTFNG